MSRRGIKRAALAVVTSIGLMVVGSPAFAANGNPPTQRLSDCKVSAWAGDKTCWKALAHVQLEIRGTKGAGYHVNDARGGKVLQGKLNGPATITMTTGDVFIVEDPLNPFANANEVRIEEWSYTGEPPRADCDVSVENSPTEFNSTGWHVQLRCRYIPEGMRVRGILDSPGWYDEYTKWIDWNHLDQIVKSPISQNSTTPKVRMESEWK